MCYEAEEREETLTFEVFLICCTTVFAQYIVSTGHSKRLLQYTSVLARYLETPAMFIFKFNTHIRCRGVRMEEIVHGSTSMTSEPLDYICIVLFRETIDNNLGKSAGRVLGALTGRSGTMMLLSITSQASWREIEKKGLGGDSGVGVHPSIAAL